MIRPCFIVVDREFASSISTRKLVIETAKFNVITAYSAAEALETVKKFPAVDGAVVDAAVQKPDCGTLIQKMKEVNPALKVVVIQGPNAQPCVGADYSLNSFEPAELLECLRQMEPVRSAEIEKRNEELEDAL